MWWSCAEATAACIINAGDSNEHEKHKKYENKNENPKKRQKQHSRISKEANDSLDSYRNREREAHIQTDWERDRWSEREKTHPKIQHYFHIRPFTCEM